MAIWQEDFFIIPKDFKFNTEDIGTFPINFFTFIEKETECFSNFFNKEQSWSENIFQYGNLDSTCIEISIFDLDIEISCRFDLRNITREEIESIINFVTNINGIFFYNNTTIDADYKSLITILKNGNAFKFCNNPELYFNNLGDK